MATLQKKFLADRSITVRRQGATQQGAGGDIHMLFGPTGSTSAPMKYRSLVRFAHVWTGMSRIVKVEMVLRQDTNGAVNHFSPGSKARVHVRRALSAWSSGNNTDENVWRAPEYEWPSQGAEYAEADLQMTSGHPVDAAYLFVDITKVIQPIADPGVVFLDGTKGGGKTNNGFIVRAPGEETNAAQRGIFMAFDDNTASNRPYLLVTYDSSNQRPNAPTLSAPSTTAASFGDKFEGLHSDPDGDPMAGRVIRVYKGATLVWTLPANLQAASSDESLSGIFSVPLSLAAGSLSSLTDYTWTATTKDGSGSEGLPSAARALRIASSLPSVVATAIPPVAAMANALFGGTYSQTGGLPLAGFQMQFRALTSHDDAGFADPATYLWDTGEAQPVLDEVTSKIVSRSYGGARMAVGTYTYRIRVKASDGGWSLNWSYADFQLTTAYDPGLGDVELTTQIARNAPVRIALYSVFTTIAHTTRAPGRGLGYLIGYIDDPMDLGGSAYLNGGGEIYFTLPALHPYVSVIEPRQVHYAVEQYYGDRYRPLFNGLITDFDADPEEVVFYGADYLGLLQSAVDERGSANPELESNGAGGGGSKYQNKALDYIIRDQLLYHKGVADSPVGFLSVPASGASFSPLVERVILYSTYAEALPFITGVIDSHKQGSGRECRLYARPTNATYTAWEWALIDNWGKDRPNIRLEYGGLLNDFRVVALGDFGTRVLAIGQKRGEAQVYRKAGLAGLPEPTFGRVAKTRFYPDIKDENDLQRRANEEASQLAKIGKRMALAIRADMLSPFDGWDLGDSIVVDIERGVVDSSEYGSLGLWTIIGVEWRYFSDGHTDLTLTVLPKKTASTPPTDLIPSGYPGVPLDWQVGYGVPTTYGEPASATPPPVALRAAKGDEVTALTALPLSPDPVYGAGYQDLNTGCTYTLDQEVYDPPFDPLDPLAPLTPNPTYNTYSLVACPPEAPGGGGGTVDTTPPPIVSIRDLVALEATQQDDGTTASALKGMIGYGPPYPPPPVPPDPSTPPAGLDDLAEIIVQSTRYAVGGNPDWTRATEWRTVSEDATGTLDTPIVQPNTLAGETYYWRATVVDKYGNRQSGWSLTRSVEAASDLVPPARPTGIVIVPGMNVIGMRWSPVLADDFDHTEVQIRLAARAALPADPAHVPPVVGYPARPVGPWVSVTTGGTLVVLTGLQNTDPVLDPVTYELRLRSVDTSDNVMLADGTQADVSDPEAGWVDHVGDDPAAALLTASPTALPGSALVWDAAIIEDVFAGMIDADWITAGTLHVGGKPLGPMAHAIEVYDIGVPAGPGGVPPAIPPRLVGTWDATGITLLDPANPQYKMTLDESGLVIWAGVGTADVYKAVTLNPLGIDAASITFGSARGGHNLVPNSSFELGAFVTTPPPSTQAPQWDVAADWNAAGSRQGADINVSTNANDLTMASVT